MKAGTAIGAANVELKTGIDFRYGNVVALTWEH